MRGADQFQQETAVEVQASESLANLLERGPWGIFDFGQRGQPTERIGESGLGSVSRLRAPWLAVVFRGVF